MIYLPIIAFLCEALLFPDSLMKRHLILAAFFMFSCSHVSHTPNANNPSSEKSKEIMTEQIRNAKKLNSSLQRAMLKDIDEYQNSDLAILFKVNTDFTASMRDEIATLSIQATFTTSTIATAKISVSDILKLHDLDWVTSIELSQIRQRK